MFTKTKITFICLTLSLPLLAFGGDAKEALLAGMRKQLTSGPYRVNTTITSEKGASEMDGEVVPPDQMHIRMMIGGGATEMILIGEKGWMKMEGKWQPSPMVTGKMMSQVLQNVDEFAPGISNVQYVGEESADGKPAKVYTFHMELGEDKGGLKSDAKVWIDSGSGAPVKSEFNGEAMGIKSKTVQTIKYDSTIKIEAPMK